MDGTRCQKTMKYKGNLSTKLHFSTKWQKCTYDLLAFNRRYDVSLLYTVLNSFLSTIVCVKLAPISHWNAFSLGKCGSWGKLQVYGKIYSEFSYHPLRIEEGFWPFLWNIWFKTVECCWTVFIYLWYLLPTRMKTFIRYGKSCFSAVQLGLMFLVFYFHLLYVLLVSTVDIRV